VVSAFDGFVFQSVVNCNGELGKELELVCVCLLEVGFFIRVRVHLFFFYNTFSKAQTRYSFFSSRRLIFSFSSSFGLLFSLFTIIVVAKKLSKGPAFEELLGDEKFNLAVFGESDVGVGVVLRAVRRVADVKRARYFSRRRRFCFFLFLLVFFFYRTF